jgi:hypothetical protein
MKVYLLEQAKLTRGAVHNGSGQGLVAEDRRGDAVGIAYLCPDTAKFSTVDQVKSLFSAATTVYRCHISCWEAVVSRAAPITLLQNGNSIRLEESLFTQEDRATLESDSSA